MVSPFCVGCSALLEAIVLLLIHADGLLFPLLSSEGLPLPLALCPIPGGFAVERCSGVERPSSMVWMDAAGVQGVTGVRGISKLAGVSGGMLLSATSGVTGAGGVDGASAWSPTELPGLVGVPVVTISTTS